MLAEDFQNCVNLYKQNTCVFPTQNLLPGRFGLDRFNCMFYIRQIMISVFRGEEVRAWIDLNETGIPPAMYCFKLEGQRIHIFMEKIDNGMYK